MHTERRWVIRSLIVIAVLTAGIVTVTMTRTMRSRGAAEAPGGTEQVDSQKDLAAALKDPARRDEAVRGLRGQKGPEAIALLAGLGLKSADAEVRAVCMTALGEIGDAQGVHPLTTGARDGEVAVRVAAVQALGKIGTDTCHDALGVALTDMDLSVRVAAATALGAGKGATAAVAAMAKSLTDEEDVEVRRLLAVALGKVKDEPARERLIGVVTGEQDAAVRLAAVESLGAWKDAHRVRGVAAAMGDADDTVRARATELFREVDAAALPALGAALQSAEMLRAVGGKFGDDVLDTVVGVLATLKSPETIDPLIRVLDIAAGTGEAKLHAAPLGRAVAQLSSLGEPVIAPLAALALRQEARMALKQAAASVLAGLGQPAQAAIRAYVSSRKMLPSSDESALWIRTLEKIGGQGAAEAVAEAKARDPVEVFKRFAAAAEPPSAVRPPAPQLQEFALTLYGAIYPGNPPNAYARRGSNLPFLKAQQEEAEIVKYEPKSRASVMLDLVKLDNGWDRIVGHSGSYYNSIAFGKLDKIEIADSGIEAALRLDVARDPWMMGGFGEYTVSMKRLADGSYRGRYTGRYRDVPVEGIATCVEKPKRRPLRAGFRPVEPEEHPRILFRREDLPGLRARLNTPFGRVAFERMATAEYIVRHEAASFVHVALGMLYQLTGDERYAAQAVPMVEREMADRDFGFMGLGQVWGGRFGNIAMAYDLCYAAWSPAFRAAVKRYLVNASYAAATNMGKFSSCANTHPCSNYFSPIVGGASMLALAYWMDPGSPPTEPVGTKVLRPAALAQRPADGVPVVPLVTGEAPAQWLWSGPVYVPAATIELVESLGDTAAAPIREGRKFSLAGKEFGFEAPPPGVQRADGLYPWLYIAEQNPECTGVGMLLYTVIENARPGYYTAHLPAQGMSYCLINGTEVADRAYVRLDAGCYPLLMAFAGDKDTMVSVRALFRFLTDSDKEMDVLIAEGREKLKSEQLLHEITQADHKATGMDGTHLHTLEMTLAHMYRSHRLLMGSGGYQSEGEMYHHTAITPIQYAAACWNVFGQTLSPYPDATHSVARHLAHAVLVEPPRGAPSLAWQSFNGGNYSGNPYHFTCAGFAFTPEEYKPAMLWLWNRMAGVNENDPGSYTNLVSRRDLGDVIYTFVNYPLDPKTGTSSLKPVHPNESFPRTWQAVDKGLYAFRNQWRDMQDIVVQVYANQLMSKGHGQPDAAGIRLHGLGFDWTGDSPGKGTPYRWLQNVVFLPMDDPDRRSPGVVTSWQAESNGSGRVSMNMDLVYKESADGKHDAVGIWPADPPAPGRVRGLRAVAADYSGKCGAPALFVLVDKVTGGGERKWLWHTPSSDGGRAKSAKSDDLRVETAANGFTIHQGDASLRAVFVTPDAPAVEAPGTIMARHSSDEKYAVQSKKDRNFKPDPEPTPIPIVATAPAEGSFFVVMTMQKGPAPEVAVVKAAGLDSVVRVGARQIRFDGENALIEDAAK